MSDFPLSDACPCQSGLCYGDCCFLLHRKMRSAPTAEALMRSRYSAFVLLNADYLLYSWHPSTAPTTLEFDRDLTWNGLSITHTSGGGPFDAVGSVTFMAYYECAGVKNTLTEKSHFSRWEKRWVYESGIVTG
ncbi:hypothetical protein CMUST_07800 [Corynebacterium mustelae]|uniref:YchJ-like middle NTF2-like domain-containing protein n=1 Tax=Corynebacterium mustelae TaxID=571915 RepID=A0A0G3GZD1_9CORY|nr:YchJ family metal-binding protein [Corynebacterium mustelae]AKK05885.1 hypothetical protein CMUST_07800 [Corynebacterium mustelae]